MMNFIRNTRLIIFTLAILISVSGCKSSKKAAEAARAAEEKAKIEREAAAKKDEDLRKKQEAEERASREAQAKQQQQETEKQGTPYTKLNQYFDAIAGSANLSSANSNIQEALGLFASEDAPVLIVISGTGDQKDYDRPTTIKKYLNYLKDQKKNINKIDNLQFDSSGKITEVELSKN